MPTVNAQNVKTRPANPDEAQYAIQGRYEKTKVNGAIHYRLHNPTSTPTITFKQPQSGYIEGRRLSGVFKNFVAFPFDSVVTNPPTELKNLRYWYYDTIDHEWVTESEVRDVTDDSVKVKQIEVMLVIDCSESLGDDFDMVTSSAINFIEQLYTKSKGNARLGVIGFHGSQMVIEPRRLDANSKETIKSKIRGWSAGIGTSLYLSMDSALTIMQEDAQKNIKADEFNGAFLIAFTDGLDNISVNDAKNLLTADDYYKYLQTRTVGRNLAKIHGRRIEPWIVSVRGVDIPSESRAKRVRDQFDNLVPYNHHKYLSNIRELNRTFADICDELISRSTTLYCVVPEAVVGRVGWTLDDIVVVEQPKPKPTGNTRTPWWGIGAEFTYGPVAYFAGGINFDIDFSINRTFAIGGRVGMFFGNAWMERYQYGYYGSYNYYYDEIFSFGFLIGPEAKITFPKDDAVIVSVGGGMMYWGGAAYFSLGYKLRKPYYIWAEYIFSSEAPGGFGIGFGWSFGGKLKN